MGHGVREASWARLGDPWEGDTVFPSGDPATVVLSANPGAPAAGEGGEADGGGREVLDGRPRNALQGLENESKPGKQSWWRPL